MKEAQIQPHKIRSPIQLLAVWFAALVLLDGSLLTAAGCIEQPLWVAPMLAIAAIVFIPTFLVLAFVMLTKFRPHLQGDEYFSGWLRRKEAELRAAVDNANVTTETVKRMAASMVRTVLGMVAAQGRWGGTKRDHKIIFVNEMDQMLKKLGFVDSEIKNIHEIYDKYLLWDHGSVIVGAIAPKLKGDKTLIDQAKSLIDFSKFYVASPSEFRSFVKDNSICDSEIEERINDMEHYIEFGELRRPDKWQA